MTNKRSVVITILIFLMLAFIWGNSLLPTEKSDGLSRWVLEHVFREDRGGADFAKGNHLLRKAAHMTEFAILAALIVFQMREKKRFWLYGALAIPAAAIDETIQIFSRRGSQLKDVGIDAAGAVLGTLIITLLLRAAGKKRR